MAKIITGTGVVNFDIIQSLNTFIAIQKDLFENNKLLNNSDSISPLNLQYDNIEEKITDTINHFQTTAHGIKIKNHAKSACKELRELSTEVKETILLKGGNFLEKQKELEEAFRFELTKEKPMLPNYLEIEVEFLSYINQDSAVKIEKPTKKVEDNAWFKVGLQFANGVVYELNNQGFNATQIAKQLGNKTGYRPYISTSLGVSNHEKNILLNSMTMKIINDHCKKHNIEMCNKFLSKLKELNVV